MKQTQSQRAGIEAVIMLGPLEEKPLTEDFHLAIWHESQHPNVNQILNLILQGPTAIGVVSRAVGVVTTKCVGTIVRSGGIELPRRVP